MKITVAQLASLHAGENLSREEPESTELRLELFSDLSSLPNRTLES